MNFFEPISLLESSLSRGPSENFLMCSQVWPCPSGPTLIFEQAGKRKLFPTKIDAVIIFEPEVGSLGCKELTLLEFYGIAVTLSIRLSGDLPSLDF
jgi:hypothetical protein